MKNDINLYAAAAGPARHRRLPSLPVLAGMLTMAAIAAWHSWLVFDISTLREQTALISGSQTRAVRSAQSGNRALSQVRESKPRHSVSAGGVRPSEGLSGPWLAERLADIARARPPTLQFEAIEIDHDGAVLTIAGTTKTPASVPEYLIRLETNHLVAMRVPGDIRIERSSSAAAGYDFIVQQQFGPAAAQ